MEPTREITREKRDKPTGLPCYFLAPYWPGRVLANLLPTSGVRVYEIRQRSWLIGFVKHTRCTDFLYFPYLLFVSVCKILASFQLIRRPPWACWTSFRFSRRPSLLSRQPCASGNVHLV
jgi:hypothetical protein